MRQNARVAAVLLLRLRFSRLQEPGSQIAKNMQQAMPRALRTRALRP